MGQPRPLIAVLLGAPLTAQNYRRTGIPYLVAHFDVVVLDCNRWLRPGYSSLSYVMHPYPDREEISSAEDFASAISGLKPTFAVDFICPGEWTDYIQKVLGDQGTQFVVQKMGPCRFGPPGTLRGRPFWGDASIAFSAGGSLDSFEPAEELRRRTSRYLQVVVRWTRLLGQPRKSYGSDPPITTNSGAYVARLWRQSRVESLGANTWCSSTKPWPCRPIINTWHPAPRAPRQVPFLVAPCVRSYGASNRPPCGRGCPSERYGH